jgi:hypothetical protein
MRLNFARGLSALLVSSVVMGMCLAGEPVQSSLKAGRSVDTFQVEDVTGPNKGTSLCYRCLYGPGPVVCVFARKPSEPLAALVKTLDAKIGENAKLKGFVVLLPQDGGTLPEELRKLAADAGIKNTPLTISVNPEGPPCYELAKDADFTVLMWNAYKVRSNRAYKGALTDDDIRAIVADIPKVLKD